MKDNYNFDPSLIHFFFRSLFDSLGDSYPEQCLQLTFLFKKFNQYEKNYGLISKFVVYTFK